MPYLISEDPRRIGFDQAEQRLLAAFRGLFQDFLLGKRLEGKDHSLCGVSRAAEQALIERNGGKPFDEFPDLYERLFNFFNNHRYEDLDLATIEKIKEKVPKTGGKRALYDVLCHYYKPALKDLLRTEGLSDIAGTAWNQASHTLYDSFSDADKKKIDTLARDWASNGPPLYYRISGRKEFEQEFQKTIKSYWREYGVLLYAVVAMPKNEEDIDVTMFQTENPFKDTERYISFDVKADRQANTALKEAYLSKMKGIYSERAKQMFSNDTFNAKVAEMTTVSMPERPAADRSPSPTGTQASGSETVLNLVLMGNRGKTANVDVKKTFLRESLLRGFRDVLQDNTGNLALPWITMNKPNQWREFFTEESFPPDFEKLDDPSRFNKATCDAIIEHWRKREDAGLKWFEFTNTPEPAKKAGTTGPKRGRKKKSTPSDSSAESGAGSDNDTLPSRAVKKSKQPKPRMKKPTMPFVAVPPDGSAGVWPDRLEALKPLLRVLPLAHSTYEFLNGLRELVNDPLFITALENVLPILDQVDLEFAEPPAQFEWLSVGVLTPEALLRDQLHVQDYWYRYMEYHCGQPYIIDNTLSPPHTFSFLLGIAVAWVNLDAAQFSERDVHRWCESDIGIGDRPLVKKALRVFINDMVTLQKHLEAEAQQGPGKDLPPADTGDRELQDPQSPPRAPPVTLQVSLEVPGQNQAPDDGPQRPPPGASPPPADHSHGGTPPRVPSPIPSSPKLLLDEEIPVDPPQSPARSSSQETGPEKEKPAEGPPGSAVTLEGGEQPEPPLVTLPQISGSSSSAETEKAAGQAERKRKRAVGAGLTENGRPATRSTTKAAPQAGRRTRNRPA